MNIDPDLQAATDAIRELRDEIIPPIEATMPTGRILTTGLSANNVDFLEVLDTYTPIVFIFVLGLSFILLVIVFRSLVVAAKAIAMNLLSVAARLDAGDGDGTPVRPYRGSSTNKDQEAQRCFDLTPLISFIFLVA